MLAIDGEAPNTSVEVQREVQYLRTQVSTISRIVLHVLCSLCEMDYEVVHCIMYVNVQSVLPSIFRYGDVTWVSFGFSFFCVNRIICCKVSNAAYSCKCILQLKYNFYFSIVWESDPRRNVWLYVGSSQLLTWDRIQKRGKWTVNLFFTLCVGTGPIAYYTNTEWLREI